MEISGINSSAVATTVPVASTATTTDAASTPGAPPSTHGHHGGHRHAFLQSVQQALSSLGLTLPASGTTAAAGSSGTSAVQAGTSASQASDPDGDGDNDGSQADATGQNDGVRAVLHDLFQALRAQHQAGGTTASANAPNSPTARFAPPDISSDLQSLIGAVDSGSSNNPYIAKLQSDFSNLVSAANPSGSTPTLDGFLQALSQNLDQQFQGFSTATTAIGTGISTTA